MTRSFGDSVAHSVGCNAEPEMSEYVFTKEDKVIVIASDGVWEFLENIDVAKIIYPFYLQKNAEGAARAMRGGTTALAPAGATLLAARVGLGARAVAAVGRWAAARPKNGRTIERAGDRGRAGWAAHAPGRVLMPRARLGPGVAPFIYTYLYKSQGQSM